MYGGYLIFEFTWKTINFARITYNFFTKFYNSSPIGITVEGSNTLTRGLIIFGQGLNKSHPYIFPIDMHHPA